MCHRHTAPIQSHIGNTMTNLLSTLNCHTRQTSTDRSGHECTAASSLQPLVIQCSRSLLSTRAQADWTEGGRIPIIAYFPNTSQVHRSQFHTCPFSIYKPQHLICSPSPAGLPHHIPERFWAGELKMPAPGTLDGSINSTEVQDKVPHRHIPLLCGPPTTPLRLSTLTNNPCL